MNLFNLNNSFPSNVFLLALVRIVCLTLQSQLQTSNVHFSKNPRFVFVLLTGHELYLLRVKWVFIFYWQATDRGVLLKLFGV